MNTGYIVHLDNLQFNDTIGNKAKNLSRLRSKKLLVPNMYVCTWQAYLDYLHEGSPVLENIKLELQKILSPNQSYALRSSANIEDSVEHSFAGQFKTILDVRGISSVLQGIREIWETMQSEEIQAYLNKVQISHRELKMAVIIQDMIHPAVSGVAFSKNPITGLNEIVVEAIGGIGTALVQDGITPYRWVNKRGQWIYKPKNDPISLELIQEVVEQTKEISRAFKRDVDLEWVYDGKDLYWLQVRDITSTGKTNIYSNKMAREMTPGLIKPLVWSVTVPQNAHAWIRLLTEVIGKNELRPDNLIKAFHYRAYHNLGVLGEIFASLGLPRESLEMVMGVYSGGTSKPKFRPRLATLQHLPRMLSFLIDKWQFGQKAAREFHLLEVEAQAYSSSPSLDMDDGALIRAVDHFIGLYQRTCYNTILAILLMQIYNGLLKGRLGKMGIDIHHFDLTEGMEELKQYDPGSSLNILNQQLGQLEDHLRDKIQAGDYTSIQRLHQDDPFRQGVERFFAQFGHLSESGNDFTAVPWREIPEMVLRLIVNYRKPEDPSARKIRINDLHLRGLSRLSFNLIYDRARQFRLLREMYSSLLTFTVMQLREYYLAISDRLVNHGLLRTREDIFYLYDGELRAYVSGESSGLDFSTLVAQRKDEMQQCADVILPEVIFGDTLPLVVLKATDKLFGTPTSRGYYTGRVKIVRGLGDFNKMSDGAVLVIPFSDVGWTPLFGKAGGIISESGGMLSHSSIIAREYSIPAVVSVVNATNLLRDGDLVTVDGFKGEVILHEAEPM